MGRNITEEHRLALQAATNEQIAHIAYNTANWYKAGFLQSLRFTKPSKTDVLNEPFKLPWTDYCEFPFVPEKLFFIIAVDHILDNIQDLSIALNDKGDARLEDIEKELLDTDNFHQRIRDIRNANEHYVDYYLGIGKKQDQFNRTISTDICKELPVNLQAYVHIRNKAFIGDMEVMYILNHLYKKHNEIIMILENIYKEYIVKGNS